MRKESQLDENVACDVCGRFSAFTFGERHLCVDCYEGCGSCCPEFGADDLWTFPKEEEASRKKAQKTQD